LACPSGNGAVAGFGGVDDAAAFANSGVTVVVSLGASALALT